MLFGGRTIVRCANTRGSGATVDETGREGSTTRYDAGMQARRRVLGDAHVDRATAAVTPLDADFQRWITETVWGGVWTRDVLDDRTRSMVTIAILAALGREELDLHLRATANTGVTPAEVAEVLLHVAVYERLAESLWRQGRKPEALASAQCAGSYRRARRHPACAISD